MKNERKRNEKHKRKKRKIQIKILEENFLAEKSLNK